MKRQVITEATVRRAHRDKQPLLVKEGAIITPAARDAINDFDVAIKIAGETTRHVPAAPRFRLIGFGYAAEQDEISHWVGGLFDDLGIEYRNHGQGTGDDILAQTVQICKHIQDGIYWRGVILDTDGIATDVLANKFAGIRSSLISEPQMALIGRQTADINLLVLAGSHLGRETIRQIGRVFLKTDFDGENNCHNLERINEIEEKKGI
ncbi:RpiB/LacA/LacB family sugar-phosphate isomerase [Candidatus Neomarinimicrobiota bacterium]